MVKGLLLAGVVLGLASASFAKADPIGTTETFNLTVDPCGCASGSTVFGTITLDQTSTGVVTVTETLNSPSAFVATGAGNSLVFDLTGDPAITIGNLTTGFQVNTANSTKDSPFADGDYSITCSSTPSDSSHSCGPGASTTNPGPLSFTVTDAAGVNISDFSPIETCYSSPCEAIYFSSDIIGPSGKTGVVGSLAGTLTPPASTPEPTSLALLGTSVLGLAGLVRRRYRCCS